MKYSGSETVAEVGVRVISKPTTHRIATGKNMGGKKRMRTNAMNVAMRVQTIPMTHHTKARMVETIAASCGLFPKGAMMNMDQLVRERPVRMWMAIMIPALVPVKSLTFHIPAIISHAGR